MASKIFKALLVSIILSSTHPVIAGSNVQLNSQVARLDVADRKLRLVYETEWAWRQQQLGLETRDGKSILSDYLPSITAASQSDRLVYWRDVLSKIDEIPFEELSPEEQINAVVFRTWVSTLATQVEYKTYEAPFEGPFWNYLSESEPFQRAADYRAYLGRMKDIPRYFDEQIVNMRAGLERGFSAPRAAIEGYDRSVEEFLAEGEQSPFYAPFNDMPVEIAREEQEALRSEAIGVIRHQVIPAYANLLVFMRDRYMPHTRTAIDASSLPDGKRYYQDRIREFTTLDVSPDEIHAIGLREVARIDSEMRQTVRASGFKGSFDEFVNFLRTDPQFYAKSERELLSQASYVAKRMDGKLKLVFELMPRNRFTILPVPEAISPYYAAGAGGVDACLINTHNLKSRPLYSLVALTLHECSPGHSWQQALATEHAERPAFRRDVYFSVLGEGWGLYAEWLGSELGMYQTPYEEFGRLTYEMLRASRLVIDTGIHAKGWSRQKAVDYLSSHSALAASDIEFEVNRYILWPGQAVSYKIGEMTIKRLRAQAQTELGRAFDQRRFHDMILALGSVPLSVLEQETVRFISAERKRGTH